MGCTCCFSYWIIDTISKKNEKESHEKYRKTYGFMSLMFDITGSALVGENKRGLSQNQ
jgi:hypothetical protein